MYVILLIVAVSCLTIASQLVLKKGLTQLDPNLISTGYLRFLFWAALSPYTIAAVAMQGVGYLLWIFVVAHEKLGVAFAISGSFFYIILALASWYFYGERLTMTQWVGLVFITVGVILITSHAGQLS